jgi:hypothetical protein
LREINWIYFTSAYGDKRQTSLTSARGFEQATLDERAKVPNRIAPSHHDTSIGDQSLLLLLKVLSIFLQWKPVVPNRITWPLGSVVPGGGATQSSSKSPFDSPIVANHYPFRSKRGNGPCLESRSGGLDLLDRDRSHKHGLQTICAVIVGEYCQNSVGKTMLGLNQPLRCMPVPRQPL